LMAGEQTRPAHPQPSAQASSIAATSVAGSGQPRSATAGWSQCRLGCSARGSDRYCFHSSAWLCRNRRAPRIG
jgi:hypothetical protein